MLIYAFHVTWTRKNGPRRVKATNSEGDKVLIVVLPDEAVVYDQERMLLEKGGNLK